MMTTKTNEPRPSGSYRAARRNEALRGEHPLVWAAFMKSVVKLRLPGIYHAKLNVLVKQWDGEYRSIWRTS